MFGNFGFYGENSRLLNSKNRSFNNISHTAFECEKK